MYKSPSLFGTGIFSEFTAEFKRCTRALLCTRYPERMIALKEKLMEIRERAEKSFQSFVMLPSLKTSEFRCSAKRASLREF